MQKVKISDITNNLDNRRIPLNSLERSKKTKLGLYPYVGANNIQGYIDEYIFDEKILCIAEDGGSWGKNQICAVIINEKCWVNNHAHVLTAKDNLVLEYLMYYFNYADLSLHINGATRGKLTQGTLNSLKIPLPNLPTQQKIADILNKADELRQYNKQLIEKYDALTQSLFLDMFGDPVKNEKGWEKTELKKFGKIITGNTPPRNDDENYSSDFIEWLKTDNINDKFINVTQAKEYLSEKGFSKARFVEDGALLVACIAGSIESIGRASLTNRKVSFNQQINAIQPFDDVNSKYLYNLFRISKKHIQNHASNGMKRMLTKGEFEKILMIKPPINLQNLFAEQVQLIEAQKQQAQEALAKNEALFQGLLQQAFNGELN